MHIEDGDAVSINPGFRKAAVITVTGTPGLHVILELNRRGQHCNTGPVGGSDNPIDYMRGVPFELVTIVNAAHLALVEPAEVVRPAPEVIAAYHRPANGG